MTPRAAATRKTRTTVSHMPQSLPNRSWSQVASALRRLPRAGLVRLLKDLYDAHPPVRTFLEGRLEVGPLGRGVQSALADAERQLAEVLQAAATTGQPPLQQARDIVNAYQKAAMDEAGALRLMLIVTEWCFQRLGDPTVPAGPELSSQLRGWLRRLDRQLRTPEGSDARAALAPQLRQIATLAGRCGDGWGDTIPAWVDELLIQVRESTDRQAPWTPTRRRSFDGDPDFDTA